VGVVAYKLLNGLKHNPHHRLVTSTLKLAYAPPAKLATIYNERREIESALDELKTPDRVRQEVQGSPPARVALHELMPEAALVGLPREPNAPLFGHTL